MNEASLTPDISEDTVTESLRSAALTPRRPLNPCELEIDLFAKGIRVDSLEKLDADARPIHRTRAGLGSGLEIVIPGRLKDVWVNVPVEEAFARQSCYRLTHKRGGWLVVDERQSFRYPVRLPPHDRVRHGVFAVAAL